MHEDPSYFPIFDINLRDCCKKTLSKKTACCMTKKMPIFVLHFFVANFPDNIIVLNANNFQVFSTISFIFRLLFSQISSQTRKSDFAKQKLSIEKRFTFFPTFAMKAFLLIASEKNFLTFKILLFLWMYARILQFLRSKTHLIEIYFRKIYFPTIRIPAIHSIHFVRNSFFKRNSFIFWTIAKCRSQSATSNYPEFFSFFFIRNLPRVKTPTKN